MNHSERNPNSRIEMADYYKKGAEHARLLGELYSVGAIIIGITGFAGYLIHKDIEILPLATAFTGGNATLSWAWRKSAKTKQESIEELINN